MGPNERGVGMKQGAVNLLLDFSNIDGPVLAIGVIPMQQKNTQRENS